MEEQGPTTDSRHRVAPEDKAPHFADIDLRDLHANPRNVRTKHGDLTVPHASIAARGQALTMIRVRRVELLKVRWVSRAACPLGRACLAVELPPGYLDSRPVAQLADGVGT